MFLADVTIDLWRLFAPQFAVRTLESGFVSALVLVMPITVTFQREAVQTLGTVIEQAIFAHVVARFYHAHQRVQHAQICKEETKYGERPFQVFELAIIIQLARQFAFFSLRSSIEGIDLSVEQGNTIDDVFGARLEYAQTHPWPTMSSLVYMYRVKKKQNT